ncbi:MAG: hypothetical protein AUI16_02345 [Alphaproteobacteria bacterium 13_2_20CM_2_64_7]|nr:MAG: hypothetical protein AUI16_02345 [Alphaproteobacteria bacterium 13_2_20CM_2_64_7]
MYSVFWVVVLSVRDRRQHTFVGLFLGLTFIRPVAMIEVPEHLSLIEGVDLPTVLEDCQCTAPFNDEWRDVLMIQEIARCTGHVK